MVKPRRATPHASATVPAADPAAVAALVAQLGSQLDAPDAALAALASAPPPAAAAALATLPVDDGAARRALLARVAAETDQQLAMVALAALGAQADADAAATLAQLADTLPHKERRKEARRVLFQLRSQGVAVPASPTSSPAPRASAPQATIYRALASHIDGLGSRLLWLFADRPLGGAWWIVAVLNDLAGLKDLTVRDTTRKRLAAQEAEVRAKTDFVWVELPVPYGQWLVQEAVALNAESGFALPTEYLAWRELIGAPAPPVERPLAYEQVSRFEVKMRPELLRDSPHLFEEPEIDGWFLGYREVKPYATDLRRMRESRLVLSTESEEQRLERTVNQAIRELFTAPQRRALQRRLEETAYIFLSSGRPEQAKRAVAAAVEIADSDPLLLSRHPFVKALVERSIELAIQAERAGIDPTLYDRNPLDPPEG